jgi:hypothetical protein
VIESLLLALALTAAAAVGWLLLRRRGEKPAAPDKKKAAGRFGAVEIHTRSGCCEAARALEGRRFLALQAPALPLPGCTASQCACKFGKLADRRTEDRRLQQGAISSSLFMASNRRTEHERRVERSPKQR